MVGAMTPAEMRVLKSLVAVMWADGKVEGSESSVLEGLIAGFGASDAEEAEVLGWAKTARSLDDVPLSELTQEDRELLLGNAALITVADGEQSSSEKEVLQRLVQLLGFSEAKAQEIIDSTRDGAIQLGTKPLEDVPRPPPLRKKLSPRGLPCFARSAAAPAPRMRSRVLAVVSASPRRVGGSSRPRRRRPSIRSPRRSRRRLVRPSAPCSAWRSLPWAASPPRARRLLDLRNLPGPLRPLLPPARCCALPRTPRASPR